MAISRKEKKAAYFDQLQKYALLYDQILIVSVDHVGSKQFQNVRKSLRGKAIIVMGKNTTIRTCLKGLISSKPELEKLLNLMKLNVGFVFCIADPTEVRKIILENKVPAPARQGVVAPIDVSVPAGPTGMDAGSTSFFQALGIATKIVKLQIEIQNDFQIITKGQKVSASAAALLQKLNIKPFTYGLKVLSVYNAGQIINADVLDITDSMIIEKYKVHAQYTAALCRAISFPTISSVPHSLMDAFKNCVALILNSSFTFSQMENLVKQSS